MSVFSVPVTIGVDEERIAKEIERNVEQQVIDKIAKDIENTIYDQRNYYGDRKEPLRKMVREEIMNFLEKHETLIVNTAAEKLADKLSRTKAVKEKAAAVAEEVFES